MSMLSVSKKNGGENDSTQALTWGSGSTSGSKPIFSQSQLEKSIKDADGSACEDLLKYVRSGDFSHFEKPGFLKVFNEYVAKAASKNPDVLKDIFKEGSFFTNNVKAKFSTGSVFRTLVDSLVKFIAAEDKAKAFEQLLLKFYQKKSNGEILPQSTVIQNIKKSTNGNLVEGLINAATSMGIDSQLEASRKKIASGEGKVQADARDVAAKFIQFEMKDLSSLLNPDTGDILNRDGDVLVRSPRITSSDITDMGFDPESQECPIKPGQINWYSFVEKIRTLAIEGKEKELADYAQETLATYTSWTRLKISQASSEEVKELYRSMANNLVEVFTEGTAGMPESVTNLIKKTFDNAPVSTEKVHRILSGDALKTRGDATIDSILREVKSETPNVNAYKATNAKNGTKDFLAELLVGNPADKKLTTIDPETLASKEVSVKRPGEEGTGKSTFAQVAADYEKSLKAVASNVRTAVVQEIFKEGRAVDSKKVDEFRDEHRKAILDAQAKRTNDIDKDFALATKTLKERLNKFIDANEIKRADLSPESIRGTVGTFVVDLSNRIQGTKYSSEQLTKLFSGQIAALTNAVQTDSSAGVEAVIDQLVTDLTEGNIVTQSKGKNLVLRLATGDFREAADPNVIKTRKSIIADSVIKNDVLNASLFNKLIAEPNSADGFSKIAFDEIANLIESNDELKEVLMRNVPSHIETYEKLRSNPIEAGHRAYALFAEVSKDDTTKNATKLMAFLDLVRQAGLSEAKKREVVSSLFRSHITGEADERRIKIDTLIRKLDGYMIGTAHEVKGIGKAASAINVGNIGNIVEIMGTSAIRAATLREANSLVVNAQASVSADRVARFIFSFTGKQPQDIATTSSSISQGSESIFERAPENSDELMTAIDEKMTDDVRGSFLRYMGLGGKEELIESGNSKLEDSKVGSLIENAMVFFKRLASKFKLMSFSPDSKGDSNSTAATEPKPATAHS